MICFSSDQKQAISGDLIIIVQVLQSYHHNPQTESTQDDLVVSWIYECQCVFLCAISVIFTIIMLWSDNRKTVNFIFVTRIDIVYTMFSFVYHYYRYTCNYHRNVKNNSLIFFKLKSWPYKFIGYSSFISRLPRAYNNFQVVILPRWFKKGYNKDQINVQHIRKNLPVFLRITHFQINWTF